MKDLIRKYKVKDLTGQKFGKLLVLSFLRRYNGVTWFKCICDCGRIKIIRSSTLRNGDSRSCGCMKGRPVAKPRILNGTVQAYRMLFRIYKDRAKKRNQEFFLNSEEFSGLTKQNCFYCGEGPRQIIKSKYTEYIYNGIDRIDNTRGYVKDNSVACCRKCNASKGSVTKEIVKILYNHYFGSVQKGDK